MSARRILFVLAPLLAGVQRGDGPDVVRILERAAPATVTIESITEVQERTGRLQEIESDALGVIVDAAGTVLTSGSIYVEDPRFSRPKHVYATLPSGRRVEAAFLGRDDENDIAFLKLVGLDGPVPHVDFSEATEASLADEVVVLGTLPRGYPPERTFRITRVNALIEKPRPLLSLMDDVSESVGFPVFASDGRPVGIVSPGSEPRSSGGASFVLPAKAFLQAILDPPRWQTKESRAWLGISYQILNGKLAEMLGIPGRRGIVVSRVYPGMPAAEAGIEVDDAIVEIGGREIPASRDEEDAEVFARIVRSLQVGAEIPMMVARKGEVREVRITPRERPRTPGEAERFQSEALGLAVREITFFDAVELRLAPGEKGVLVQAVEPALPAGLAGLEVDDIVKGLNGSAVEDVDDFRRSIGEAGGGEAILFVLRDHQTRFIRIRP